MSNIAQLRPSKGVQLQPQSLDEAMQLAQMVTKSALCPNTYKGKPEDALVAFAMGAELGLNPIQSLQNIAVINGKPSIYGDALVALVRASGRLEDIKEEFDEKTMTATCTVKRRSNATPTVARFSYGDAEQAGLLGKSGPWKTYPKRMCQWRARGYALRDAFADVLGGLITAEEAQDMPAQPAEAIDHVEAETDPLYDELLAIAHKGWAEFSAAWKELSVDKRSHIGESRFKNLKAIAKNSKEAVDGPENA